MDYLIANTTKEQRTRIVKQALAISITGADIADDEILEIVKEYVDGKTELKEVQQKIIERYKRG